MSETIRFVPYGDELTDDPPMAIISISRHWLPYLIAIAENLKNPELWNPIDDVELAVSQADDCIARLLGSDVLESAVSSPNPILIPCCSMLWNPSAISTYQYVRDNAYTFSQAVSNNDIGSLDCCYFWVFLPAGEFTVTVYYQGLTAGGNYNLICAELGTIQYQVDTYRSAMEAVCLEQTVIENPTAQVLNFKINRNGRNSSSSGGTLRLQAVEIQSTATECPTT